MQIFRHIISIKAICTCLIRHFWFFFCLRQFLQCMQMNSFSMWLCPNLVEHPLLSGVSSGVHPNILLHILIAFCFDLYRCDEHLYTTPFVVIFIKKFLTVLRNNNQWQHVHTYSSFSFSAFKTFTPSLTFPSFISYGTTGFSMLIVVSAV